MENPTVHRPVMVREVIEFLRLKKTYKILDATVGCGGHAESILRKIEGGGFLIGIDCDELSLEIARDRLRCFGESCKLVHANFNKLDEVLRALAVDRLDGMLFDLGVSSYQLEQSGRGFSFLRDEPLDMRMDLSLGLRASDIVQKYRRKELECIIHNFGGERYFRRIVTAILMARRRGPLGSTLELSNVVKRAVGQKYKYQKIHPATRTFQALRIAVNDELGNLKRGLDKAIDFLGPHRRMCIISFHSLEDRIVKTKFKEFEKNARGRIITKKPVLPTQREMAKNPRSRSARLRVFEKNEKKVF